MSLSEEVEEDEEEVDEEDFSFFPGSFFSVDAGCLSLELSGFFFGGFRSFFFGGRRRGRGRRRRG